MALSGDLLLEGCATLQQGEYLFKDTSGLTGDGRSALCPILHLTLEEMRL